MSPIDPRESEAIRRWMHERRLTPRPCATVRRWVRHEAGIEAEEIEEQIDLESISARAVFDDQLVERISTGWETLPPEYRVFLGTSEHWFSNRQFQEMIQLVEVVVRRLADQFSIVHFMETQAVNYGLTTQKLVKALRQLNEQWPIEILGAELDQCRLRFRSYPEDSDAAIQALDQVCPDLLAQMLSLEEPRKRMQRRQLITLWWD